MDHCILAFRIILSLLGFCDTIAVSPAFSPHIVSPQIVSSRVFKCCLLVRLFQAIEVFDITRYSPGWTGVFNFLLLDQFEGPHIRFVPDANIRYYHIPRFD